jgi:hypothetical protein
MFFPGALDLGGSAGSSPLRYGADVSFLGQPSNHHHYKLTSGIRPEENLWIDSGLTRS